MADTRYCDVALGLPLRRTFHYRIPEELMDRVRAGARLRVPFGPREVAGWCVGLLERPQVERVRDVAHVIGEAPPADGELLDLTRWMAERYLCSWGQALDMAVPAAVKAAKPGRTVEVAERGEVREPPRSEKRRRVLEVLAGAGGPMRVADLARRAGTSRDVVMKLAQQGAVKITRVPAEIEWLEDADPDEPPRDLTEEQARALEAVRAIRGSGVLLVRGVTGSGKTEIYLRAAQDAIAAGGQTLLLVPEIALTAQMVSRVRARFDRVAVLHSQMSPWERAKAWRDARSGAVDLVVGARSAVFTPFRSLGLIVIDEEHEPSFKEHASPRYHARDVAEWRAKRWGVPLILGGATPCVETYHRARTGEIGLAELTRRIGDRALPEVEVVHMEHERQRTGRPMLLSRRLTKSLAEALQGAGQAILFLNRRGFVTCVTCRRCGWVMRCPRCAAGMIVHRQIGRALCHYCLQGAAVPERCPECLKGKPRHWGAGTEKVEEEIRRIHPSAGVIRMDSDSMTTRAKLRDALERFRRREAQVLVGTKMVAKGLHFPGVTLVGVVNADTAFQIPDYRAAETTFQEISQVAGRPGRGEKPGRVIVQTVNANHYAIRAAAKHDYVEFYEREVEFRRELGYPPFGTVYRILFEGRNAGRVREMAQETCGKLGRAMDGIAEILGPEPCPMPRLRGRDRQHAVVKARDDGAARKAIAAAVGGHAVRGGVEISVDVNPYGMM